MALLLLLVDERCCVTVVVLFVRGVLYVFDDGVDDEVETRVFVLLFTALL